MNVRVLERVATLLDPSGGELALETPGKLAQYVDHRIIQTPAHDILDEVLMDAANGTSRRVIISMAPQEGKSERVSRTYPLWLLRRNPSLRIAVVSYADNLARRASRAVRNDIVRLPELGLRLAYGTTGSGEWKLEGTAGGDMTMVARGIHAGISGRPVDVLVIDDPFADRAEAESAKMRDNVWEWWTDSGSARFGNEPIVILIMTRWHQDDLAGRLLRTAPDDWRHVNIPAQAEHDPAKGSECRCGQAPDGSTICLGRDILRRKPGEFMISARGRTQEGWELRKRTAGSRSWSALYQGTPNPTDGDIFKRGWFRHHDTPRAVLREDGTWWALGAERVAISCDFAFKDTKTSDFVAIQVWAKNGAKAWPLYQIHDRLSFSASKAALQQVVAMWPQAKRKLVEDKANGTAIIDSLKADIPGIIAITPTESKLARAESVAPLVEAGDVEFPSPLLPGYAWVAGLIDEACAFPNGAHDDRVDGMTQMLRYWYVGPKGARARVLGGGE
jgi:predicted phage terminase large subunit-like protein